MEAVSKRNILSCFEVADYFLVLVDREAGDTITQLKLQKLVYLAQGVSLALWGKPLFKEEIEAWQHGPVAKDLRKRFGNLKDGTIPAPGEMDFDLYSEQDKELIYKVYSVYGEHSASYLRDMTHEHQIWYEAYNNEGNNIITKDKMQAFFKQLIAPDFLSMSEENKLAIVNAEDQWWMSYDSGVVATDVTSEILESAKELQAGKGIGYNLVW